MIFDKETVLQKLEEKSNQKYEEMKSALAKTMLEKHAPAPQAPAEQSDQ